LKIGINALSKNSHEFAKTGLIIINHNCLVDTFNCLIYILGRLF